MNDPMIMRFLKLAGLKAVTFQNLVGRNTDFVQRMKKQEPDSMTRYAMAAIAAGLEPWDETNHRQCVMAKNLLAVAKGDANASD